ncbi:MAG: MFS transporter [Acidimicrobiales bacterium]
MKSAAPTRVALPTLLGVTAAAALVPLNSTMIVVALPDIADDFDVATGSTGVLITVYLVTMLVGQPLSGRLSDRVGVRRMVTVALLGFAAASVAASLAGTFVMLLVFRVIQAVFASALSPGVQALLRVMSDARDRGRSFGLLGSALGTGAAVGPIIGGVAVALFGWQAVFLVNLPVVAVALYALRGLAVTPPGRPRARGDAPHGGGRILNPVFGAAYATQALSTLTQYTFLLVVPVVLDARSWGAGKIGLALSAMTVGMIVSGPAGGRLGDLRGRRYPVRFGLGAASVATVAVAVGGADMGSVGLLLGTAVFGLGFGLATPSVITVALESVPEDLSATAAGLFGTGRYVGSIPASLLVAFAVSDGIDGVDTVLMVAAVAVVGAFAASAWLPAKEPRG